MRMMEKKIGKWGGEGNEPKIEDRMRWPLRKDCRMKDIRSVGISEHGVDSKPNRVVESRRKKAKNNRTIKRKI